MIDTIIDNVFGDAIAEEQRLQRQRETRNFQQGSLAGQKKLFDAQNKNTESQNHWGRVQSGMLSKMSSTLDRINAEMAAVRKLQTESLAIQKELLARDNLQAFLEEFIYQAQKLVAECSSEQSQLAASTRYFLLSGLLSYSQKTGINTAMIRGRENKFAFDAAIDQAKNTKRLLAETDEVKEAIALRKGEKKLLAEAKAEKQAADAITARNRAAITLGLLFGIPGLILLGGMAICLLAIAFGGSMKK